MENVNEKQLDRIRQRLANLPRRDDATMLIPYQDQQTLLNLPYQEYLTTRHWKDVQEYAMKKCGCLCVLCGSCKDLNAHHRSYRHRGNYDKEKDDVFILCNDCHTVFHKGTYALEQKKIEVDNARKAERKSLEEQQRLLADRFGDFS
jgi:hypothetical protein